MNTQQVGKVLSSVISASIGQASDTLTEAQALAAKRRLALVIANTVGAEMGRSAAEGKVELRGAKLSTKSKGGTVDARFVGLSFVAEWLSVAVIGALKLGAKLGCVVEVTSIEDYTVSQWFHEQARKAAEWAVENTEE